MKSYPSLAIDAFLEGLKPRYNKAVLAEVRKAVSEGSILPNQYVATLNRVLDARRQKALPDTAFGAETPIDSH